MKCVCCWKETDAIDEESGLPMCPECIAGNAEYADDYDPDEDPDDD